MKVLIFFGLLALVSTKSLSSDSEQRREALISEARSMGYIAEHVGRVGRMHEGCGFVRFDFSEYFSDAVFRSRAIRIYAQKGFTLSECQTDVDELSAQHVNRAQAKFEFFTQNAFSQYFTQYDIHNITIPSYEPSLSEEPLGDPKHKDIIGPILRWSAEIRSLRIGDQLINELERILKQLTEKNPKLFDIVSENEELYQGIAKKILGPYSYESSIIRQYGPYRSRQLERMTLWRVGPTDISVRLCFARNRVDEGLEAFKIVPKGVLSERDNSPVYEYPLLGTNLYAQDEKKDGVTDLLEAHNVLFNFDGTFIVENLKKYWYRGCSLTDLSKCTKDYDRIYPERAVEVKLGHRSIVVTNEKYAECVDKEGPLARIELKHPIFVHDTDLCLLKVGDDYIGRYYIPFNQTSDADIVDYLSDVTDPITWYNSPKTWIWRQLGFY